MRDRYESPLCERYASARMQYIFSPDFKFTSWRKMWLYLAEAEKELGLDITDEQLDEIRAHLNDVDYDAAAAYEKRLRHDVMAHLRAFADQCPKAGPILHLGATSCYVGDNTDVWQLSEALKSLRGQLLGVMAALSDFALKNADVPTLAYTHFQAAQPTTVGKRATLWLQDFLMDFDRLTFELSRLKPLGCKGTTGTGASFLMLFNGDESKVRALEGLIARKMGFESCVAVSGQTYTRKVDAFVLNVLSGIAQSASKMATDLRLLSHLKEFDEPFESEQVGSSAMTLGNVTTETLTGNAFAVRGVERFNGQQLVVDALQLHMRDEDGGPPKQLGPRHLHRHGSHKSQGDADAAHARNRDLVDAPFVGLVDSTQVLGDAFGQRGCQERRKQRNKKEKGIMLGRVHALTSRPSPHRGACGRTTRLPQLRTTIPRFRKRLCLRGRWGRPSGEWSAWCLRPPCPAARFSSWQSACP